VKRSIRCPACGRLVLTLDTTQTVSGEIEIPSCGKCRRKIRLTPTPAGLTVEAIEKTSGTKRP